MRHLDRSVWMVYEDNRLVKRLRNIETHERISCGKRVARNCPMTREERQAYVRDGSVAAIKMLRQRLGIGLKDAYEIVKKVRGVDEERRRRDREVNEE